MKRIRARHDMEARYLRKAEWLKRDAAYWRRAKERRIARGESDFRGYDETINGCEAAAVYYLALAERCRNREQEAA